ncbi:unnamed protein product [marine sediment metagenome]|uniref:Uncharacterized protein n=1 Tax=marine sediment metagenome TaxID=412755 RepID=X0Z068_9ZZZZ
MEINERGNQVERSFFPTERYRWDFNRKFTAAGWEQYDTSQDAWYFGVWVNKRLLQIQTYAEGDLTLVKCPDAEHFNAEIKSMNEFYEEGFVAKTIDKDGKMTVYRQDRALFFIKEIKAC